MITRKVKGIAGLYHLSVVLTDEEIEAASAFDDKTEDYYDAIAHFGCEPPLNEQEAVQMMLDYWHSD